MQGAVIGHSQRSLLNERESFASWGFAGMSLDEAERWLAPVLNYVPAAEKAVA